VAFNLLKGNRRLCGMGQKILLVENVPLELEQIKQFLQVQGFSVQAVLNATRAIDLVKKNPTGFDLAVLDYNLEDLDGAETTRALLAISPLLPVLIFSADETQRSVVRSIRNGARVFVGKSEGPQVFLAEINKLISPLEKPPTVADSGENETLIARVGMKGKSAALARVADTIVRLTDKKGPVLILGDSGTGKELLARALHGDRPGKFRAINCASFWMSLDTARSELFGHVKGAFTGADRDKPGIFEDAAYGTVFLDEIYSLPMEAQIGILRALQERTVTRLGDNREIKIDCRVVAAAKPDLLELTDRGVFKKDLFYRISENIVRVPPLTERIDDIAPLVSHFCESWNTENNEKKSFLKSTLSYLESYAWPGNINELKNVVYSTLNTAPNSKIGPQDLSANFRERLGEPASPNGSLHPLRLQFQFQEKEHFIETLRNSRSLRDAARKLGTSPQSVLRKIKKYGIEVSGLLGNRRA
jgi:two-component system response regulator AtoC